MYLSTEEIRPSLLRFGHSESYSTRSTTFYPRICYDYEIEFFIRSEGSIFVNGKEYTFDAGDLSIRKPGQRVQGKPPYECYVLCLDLTGRRYCPENYLFGTPETAQPLYENPLLNLLPDRLRCPNQDKFLTLLKEMESALQENLPGSRLKVNSILQYLFAEIIRETEYQRMMIPKYNQHLLKAVDFINQHFTEEIDISALIRSLGLSKAYFNRCFKEYYQMTPGEMILSKRMEKALMLLSLGDTSVSEISLLCGFADPSYFSRKFRQFYGCTPREYRIQNQKIFRNLT